MEWLDKVPTLVIIVVAVILMFLIFKTPLKFAAKLVINTLLGFVFLFIANWLGAYVGINMPINWITAAIAGILGLPGIAVILLLQWLSLI